MKSLYSKLIIPISILIVSILTIIMIFSIVYVERFIVPDINRITEDLIYSKGNEISYWINTRINEMEQLTDSLNLNELNGDISQKNIDFLSNFQENNSENYESFGIIDLDGEKVLTNRDTIFVGTREYFKEIESSKEEYIITSPIVSMSNETELILIVMKIRNDSNDIVGYLSGAVSINYLNEIINNANIYDFPIEIYNKDTNRKIISTVNFNTEIVDDKYTAFESDIEIDSNWVVSMMVPESFLDREVHETVYIIVVFGVIVLLISIYILIKYVKVIVKPIEELKSRMNFTDIKDLNTIIPDDKTLELNNLGNSYNSLIENIQRLINELEYKEKLKKEAEYKALFSQIKPHFLYNTLETIQAMAIEEDNEEVEEAIGDLATLFRIGLSGDRSFIPLEDELKHLQSYVNIQLLRYGNKFTYSISHTNINTKTSFLKFTLQPIIENSIYHGVKLMKKVGYIKVDIEIVDNKYIIKVINSFDYLDKHKIEKVNMLLNEEYERESDKFGYGLYNVNQRLKLNFGSEYGVSLKVNNNEVLAIITHPVLEEK